MDWIFVFLPQFVWSPHAQFDGIWRWGFGEVIQFQWSYGSRDLVLGLFLIIRGRETGALSLAAMWGHSKKVDIYKPGRVFRAENKLSGSLALISQSPELWVINICCLNHSLYSIKLWQPELIKTQWFMVILSEMIYLSILVCVKFFFKKVIIFSRACDFSQYHVL